jgi:hypothetical protein
LIPVKTPPLHVIVKFGDEIPSEAQGPALMEFEKNLRKSGLDIRVFKDRMGDDSKLRIKMTPAERDRL